MDFKRIDVCLNSSAQRLMVKLHKSQIRADQNTGGALLEFAMKAAMHGKSRAMSAISVCQNQQIFKLFSSLAV